MQTVCFYIQLLPWPFVLVGMKFYVNLFISREVGLLDEKVPVISDKI